MTIPIVFLHGFPFSSAMWSAELERFAEHASLAVDFPGFGGRPPAEPEMDAFARSALGDMDEAGIDRAVVVGLSMGGYVAFRVHALAPERIAALVLVDTRAGADSEEAAANRLQQARRARDEGIGWLADAQIPKLLGETTLRERPEVVQRVREMIESADPEGVARALLAMRDRPESTPELATIRVPVLAVVGEEDALTPVAEARTIAEGVPNGTLEVVPRAGHLSNLEAPDEFAAALDRFLGTIG